MPLCRTFRLCCGWQYLRALVIIDVCVGLCHSYVCCFNVALLSKAGTSIACPSPLPNFTALLPLHCPHSLPRLSWSLVARALGVMADAQHRDEALVQQLTARLIMGRRVTHLWDDMKLYGCYLCTQHLNSGSTVSRRSCHLHSLCL